MIRTSAAIALNAADPAKRFFLQDAQQTDLRLGVHGGDLIEKYRAAMGLLEDPRAGILRSGVGAPFMAENFAGNEFRGHGSRC